jgi:hypothetical protein
MLPVGMRLPTLSVRPNSDRVITLRAKFRAKSYLMPGVFVQTAVFGAMNTAVGLATDLQSGLLERFRSLPMARSAALAGRTIADLTRNIIVFAPLGVWRYRHAV